MGSKYRSFTVEVDSEGRLVVARVNGVAFNKDDAEFVRSSISAALRQRNLDARNAAHAVSINGELNRTEGRTAVGRPFEIDSMVLEIERLRFKVDGLSKRQMARELGWYTTRVSDILRGATRPHLSDIRDMAALPGISSTPTLIPAALVGRVKEMKEKFWQSR